VKSERSETNNDIESGSAGSNGINMELSLAGGSKLGSTNKLGVSKSGKLDFELSSAVPFDRASEANKPSASMNAGIGFSVKRNSNQLFAPTSTANRLSLPTVSVPINQIKSQRSRASGS